ncbi:hypothetical protein [Janthinobacterium sp. HLX7-2]|uniref:hypothetical protein n=1 Tax=Janthinobacterium sp. HLX7-2 TaxID=1259331 RepID=UPI003F2158A5
MKKVMLTLATLLLISGAPGAWGHTDHDHDEAPAQIKLELKGGKTGATVYAKSAGKNYATAGATGVLTIITGNNKTDVALQPGVDNTMVAKTATPLAAGTRAQASITFADKNTVKADLVAK